MLWWSAGPDYTFVCFYFSSFCLLGVQHWGGKGQNTTHQNGAGNDIIPFEAGDSSWQATTGVVAK